MNECKNYDPNDFVELLEQKQYSVFMQKIDELNPVDAAEILSVLPSDRLSVAFRLLKKDIAAQIFSELNAEQQSEIITRMTDREISSMLDELFVDDAVDMLEEMPAGMVKRIMASATAETRAEINRFLDYPADSAGSVMTSEFIDLQKDMTCEQAVVRIRRIGLDKETVYVAYVTDHARFLEGVVPLKSLLFADPNALIADIMNPHVIFSYTHDDKEEVANKISHYGLLALPIVDKEQRLVGIVTVDDALDVLENETTEDFEKMAAMIPTGKSYLRTGIWETWKKRIPWLIVLMLTAIFSSMIITHYETAIGTYAILTAFVPMLMNTGGNAGSQASVAIIRALSLDEISMKDFFRVVWKEFRVSVLCGICLAVVCFIKTMAIDFGFRLSTVLDNGVTQNNLFIAFTVSITVFFAVVVAKIIGAVLPIGARRIGLDPAVMASPFITTIVDSLTLIIYFAIASRVLHF